MKLMNKPTLREISGDTGIQITRVFRLFNGCSMKLEEYLIFKNKLESVIGSEDSLSLLIEESKLKLSLDTLEEIKNYVKRKLELYQFMEG